MFDDEEFLPLSSLQHLQFCRRRAALICMEVAWEDNRYTAEGGLLHRRTAASKTECRGDLRIARGLLLRSTELGLSGRADVVEFHRVQESGGNARGAYLPGLPGRWQPYPVEYKRGRLRREMSYEVQLCAQAICLEEMLGAEVVSGAIYYGSPRRRIEVLFTSELRLQTRRCAQLLHEVVRSSATPPPEYAPKCRSCSLAGLCIPRAVAGRSAGRYLAQKIAEGCNKEQQSDETTT